VHIQDELEVEWKAFALAYDAIWSQRGTFGVLVQTKRNTKSSANLLLAFSPQIVADNFKRPTVKRSAHIRRRTALMFMYDLGDWWTSKCIAWQMDVREEKNRRSIEAIWPPCRPTTKVLHINFPADLLGTDGLTGELMCYAESDLPARKTLRFLH